MESLKYLKKYLKKEFKLLLLALFVAIIFVLSSSILPYVLGRIIDEITKFINQSSTDSTEFIKFLIIALILILLAVIFQYIFDLSLGIFVGRVTRDLRNDLFIKINKLPISIIDQKEKGDLISRLLNDFDNISTGLTSGFKQFFQGIIQVIFTLIIMMIINYILGLTVLVLTPFCFIISYFIAKKTNKYFKETNKLLGNESTLFLEYINNIDVVFANNYKEEEYKKFEDLNNDLYKKGQKSQFYSSLINPLSRLVNNSTYAIVGIIGGILVCLSNNGENVVLGTVCTVGAISSFIQYANQFSKPFNEISSCISSIQNAFSSLKRVNEIFDYREDIDEGTLSIPGKINNFKFENVTFSYDGSRQIIKNFNLDFNVPKKIAIVGPTGCGKTTLINLLLRFYDVNGGAIKINDININDLKKEKLRERFGMVLQDTWIFNGTILDNIKYGKPDATLEEITEVAKKASCLSFIERMPEGFNTQISNKSGLSDGQKQLISIARVMLLNEECLILDEATSNIDTRTELKIQEAVNILSEGKTSFVIAHRLSTIVNSDLILVLKDGEIIESGKHQELLDKKGFYYKLYNSQFAK